MNMLKPVSIAKVYPFKRVPEYLIYPKKCQYERSITENSFLLFSIKDSSKKAIMYCFPEDVYRKDLGWVKSLYISYLSVFGNTDIGLGTHFLNFARKYSQHIGCKGMLHLDASAITSRERIPHVFYKKYGMNTGLQQIDKMLDVYVKKRKNATSDDFGYVTMFFPPIKSKEPEKTSVLRLLIKKLSNITYKNKKDRI